LKPRAARPSRRGRAVPVYAVVRASASRAAPPGRHAHGILLGLFALAGAALLAPIGGATAGPAAPPGGATAGPTAPSRGAIAGLAARSRGATTGPTAPAAGATGGLAVTAAGVTAALPTTAAGQPIVEGVRWPDVSLPVVVDLSELPAEWLVPVRAALTTWNDANSAFWYVEGSVGSAGLNGVRLQPTDRIMLCGGRFQPAACTLPYVYQYGPQHISHVVIQLDRERLRADRPRRPLDVIDVPALFTHELGHALGLGEAASPTAAMYTAALWSALGEDDLRELRAMYGAIQGPRERQAPLPRQPADGGQAPLQPTLRWEPVPSAVGYYVQVATAAVYQAWGGMVDLGFGEYVFDTTTEGPEYPFPRLLAEGTEYYWRVKARTTTGNSPWSAAAHFVPAALPAP
jgi:hypothetical protein